MVSIDASAAESLSNSVVEVQSYAGTTAELHALPMPTAGERAALWVMAPTKAALAMGSSQTADQFDQERLAADGVELAPRRSGGGAVFIDPASTVWIDLVAPRSSLLWSSELAENFLLVGRIWQQALAAIGVDSELCVESSARTDAATWACWAGLGWGELVHGPEGAKLVGLSQRRTRWGCRVQAMAVLNRASTRVSDYLLEPGRSLVQGTIASTQVPVEPAALEAAVLRAFSIASD